MNKTTSLYAKVPVLVVPLGFTHEFNRQILSGEARVIDPTHPGHDYFDDEPAATQADRKPGFLARLVR